MVKALPNHTYCVGGSGKISVQSDFEAGPMKFLEGALSLLYKEPIHRVDQSTTDPLITPKLATSLLSMFNDAGEMKDF